MRAPRLAIVESTRAACAHQDSTLVELEKSAAGADADVSKGAIHYHHSDRIGLTHTVAVLVVFEN